MTGAFHPDARLSWIREGAYTTRTLEEYLLEIADGEWKIVHKSFYVALKQKAAH